MDKKEIGSILKGLREKSGKTQKEVAELLGRKQQVVGHWETGYAQPDANTLFLLCKIYDADLNEAFGFGNKKSPAPAEVETEEDVFSREYGSRIIKALQLLGFIGEGQDLTERQQILMLSIYNILKLEFGKPNDFRGGVERAV